MEFHFRNNKDEKDKENIWKLHLVKYLIFLKIVLKKANRLEIMVSHHRMLSENYASFSLKIHGIFKQAFETFGFRGFPAETTFLNPEDKINLFSVFATYPKQTLFPGLMYILPPLACSRDEPKSRSKFSRSLFCLISVY